MLAGSVVLAQNPQKTVPEQGPPPKSLTVRPDGHVSANQDPTGVDKFEVHVVKQGETLSGISGEVFKNPRMWPQLWEQNEHIINPHWIYPDDKILIRPVTPLAEAKPPEPTPAPAPRQPEPEPEKPPLKVIFPAATPAQPPPTAGVIILDQRAPAPEVKFEDLYCSGFVRKAKVPNDLKVIARYDSSGAVLAAETDYVYLSKGSEDGIVAGTNYQVVRPTKTLTNPNGRTAPLRDLGMHYLDVGQLRVMMTQSDFSLGRVTHTCGDAVEVGDILMPFEPIRVPAAPRSRSFSSTMTVKGDVKGIIVSSKTVMLNFGSTFKMSSIIPGVGGNDRVGVTERGISAAGTIVYVDVGEQQNVKPGDLFIVYRDFDLDQRLFKAPKEIEKIKHTRTAIGELILLKVGERASTALVTYATDGLALGDTIERR